MNKRSPSSIVVSGCIMLCVVTQLHAQPNFVLRTSTIGSGAGQAGSGSYVLQSTLGQPANGRLANGRFIAGNGFWHQVKPTAGPVVLPVAVNDSITTDEDTAANIDVVANDENPEVGALKISQFSQPANGSVSRVSDGTLSYTPNTDFFGEDAFAYVVRNEQGGSASAEVSITVNPVNDPPSFISDPVLGAAADELYRYRVEASDVDGDGLTMTAAELPSWLSFSPSGDGTAMLAGTPTHGDVGAHDVVLEVSDEQAVSKQAFTITVIPGAPSMPILAMPEDGTSLLVEEAELVWHRVRGAASYALRVATNEALSALIVDQLALQDTSFTVTELEVGQTYFWSVQAVNAAGESIFAAPFSFIVATKVATEEDATPQGFRLEQNYPNPFNPSTTFVYRIPETAEVRLKVYDLFGREVATIVHTTQPAGRYTVPFNAEGLASGTYFYRLEAGTFSDTRQFMFLK